MRLPSTSAQTSAETPELICTTVPPAKSSTGIASAQRPVEQAALAPNHVAQREINERHPQHREQQRRR